MVVRSIGQGNGFISRFMWVQFPPLLPFIVYALEVHVGERPVGIGKEVGSNPIWSSNFFIDSSTKSILSRWQKGGTSLPVPR